MSQNMLRPFLYCLLVVSCLSLLLWTGPTESSAAAVKTFDGATGGGAARSLPKQCKPGKTSTAVLGWRFKPATQVRIYYLKNNFSAAERDAFTRAINSWNKALDEIGSRIVFNVAGEREGEVEENATITVLRGTPKGKDRVGQLRFYTMSNGVMRATMILSPTVTDMDALTSLMTHELGHSLGLADCYECKRGTTAMSAFKGENKGNDVYAPSECDKWVVANGFTGEG